MDMYACGYRGYGGRLQIVQSGRREADEDDLSPEALLLQQRFLAGDAFKMRLDNFRGRDCPERRCIGGIPQEHHTP